MAISTRKKRIAVTRERRKRAKEDLRPTFAALGERFAPDHDGEEFELS
ncbi:MAG: hypothetical protein ACYDCK_12635 [Thermoplasmatota archaeon]